MLCFPEKAECSGFFVHGFSCRVIHVPGYVLQRWLYNSKVWPGLDSSAAFMACLPWFSVKMKLFGGSENCAKSLTYT